MAVKKTDEQHEIPCEELERAAECLKVMAHPARLRMVDMLLRGRFAVHEIAEKCELSPAQTCEHLRLLQGRGFLKSEREGRLVFYSVVSPRLPRLIQCLRQTCGE